MNNDIIYKYPIEIEQDEYFGYVAHIPDLDCFGDGETPLEALKDVYEVAQRVIEIALRDGVTIPTPTLLESIDIEHWNYEYK